ncbi:MAG TPA: pyroglutamyl-peptidase I [Candidatus Binataceae bacterium]|nr:pyroglutamyl-peptidase I [Candidatus Binataceae bacterium]
MASVVLLTGFEPFGGQRQNPSWEVARRLDRKTVEGLQIRAVRLPVSITPAIRCLGEAIAALEPRVVLGLGQAGGRPMVSLERIAINLFSMDEAGGGGRVAPVIAGGPDAYFSRLPLDRMLLALRREGIPAALSLSAGAFVCNAVMYASLHALRRRPSIPAGFIHLPYEASQAARHRSAPSMSLGLMERAVELAIGAIAHAPKRGTRAKSAKRR